MRVSLAAALMVAGLLAPAMAQQSAPQASEPAAGGTPDKVPFFIPYGAPIGLDQARGLIDAALAEAGRRGWPLNVAVVDPHGDLVAFARMDDAQLASIGVSQRKAQTAARFRRESRVFYKDTVTGHPGVMTLGPEVVASPGGFPLVVGGKLIGAIGCSGGTGDQDATVCKAAAATLK